MGRILVWYFRRHLRDGNIIERKKSCAGKHGKRVEGKESQTESTESLLKDAKDYAQTAKNGSWLIVETFMQTRLRQMGATLFVFHVRK